MDSLESLRTRIAAGPPRKEALLPAPRQTTIGRLMFEDIVPEDLRGEAVGGDEELTAPKLESILEQVAHRRPEAYKDISHKLLRLGAKGSVETNTSFSLDDLEFPGDRLAVLRRINEQEAAIERHPALSKDQKQKRKMDLWRDWGEKLPEMVFQEGMKRESRLARMVASGARGSKGQLNSNVGMDMAVSDSKGRQVPVPIKHSYSQGLTPAEYFAASYGTRLGVVATKFSVQDGGYFCLAGDTEVRTPDGGSVPISELSPGDWVVGSTKDGESTPVQVKRLFRNGIMNADRYVFRCGRSRTLETSVVCTEGHEVMARSQVFRKDESRELGVEIGRISSWRKMQIGKARKGFAMMPAGGFEPIGANPEPLGFLIGFALGDGMMRGHKLTLTIGDGDSDVREYLSDILLEQGFDLKRVNRAELSYEYSVVEKVPSRYFSRGEAGEFIKGKKNPLRLRLEQMEVWGKLAHEKTLPRDILAEWDSKSLWGLVGGLIASDGSVGKNKLTPIPEVTFAVTSEALCQGLHDILTKRLGVPCLPPRRAAIKGTPVGAVGPHPDRGYVSNHDIWVLTVSHFESVKTIAENIELPGRKGRALREWLASAPEEDSSGRGGFAYHFLRREPVGEIEVFDIEVDHPDHLYVLANGMVVSNSKQLNAAAGDLIVTEDDCGTAGGLPVDPDDRESVGAVLAKDFAGVSAGTVLTPKLLTMMGKSGKGRKAVVRSPVSCRAKQGGLCKMCSGVRERNKFPELGENVGINAASGLSEPVSQALLSTKHSAGVASAGGASQVRGFAQIDALAQVPSTYPNAATLANADGVVERIEEAPQGGTYVHVGGEAHYVPPEREILVKKGQELEAGDILSSGTPNPADVVRHKGVGAGRAYFVKAFMKALKDNGTRADRRNTEVLARALVNHVRVGDDFESKEFMPGEVVEYSRLESSWVPSAGAKPLAPGKARGMFLQKPALHFTVGTRVTPSVARDLEEAGEEEVFASDEAPSFSAEMVRAMDNPAYKEDFMLHTGQSYVKRNLLNDVQSGKAVSMIHGKHWAPALARGVEFGRPPKGTVGY